MDADRKLELLLSLIFYVMIIVSSSHPLPPLPLIVGELDCIFINRRHNFLMQRDYNTERVKVEMVKKGIERSNFSPLAKFMMKCPLSHTNSTPLERLSNTLCSIRILFRNRYRK